MYLQLTWLTEKFVTNITYLRKIRAVYTKIFLQITLLTE